MVKKYNEQLKTLETMLAFVNRQIARKEKQLIEHEGLIPADFDSLARLFELQKHYTKINEEMN